MRTGRRELIRDLNRSLVLNLLREQGPLSRAGLARLSGLSSSTVTEIVAVLLADGFIREEDHATAVDSALGRPPTLLRVDPGGGVRRRAQADRRFAHRDRHRPRRGTTRVRDGPPPARGRRRDDRRHLRRRPDPGDRGGGRRTGPPHGPGARRPRRRRGRRGRRVADPGLGRDRPPAPARAALRAARLPRQRRQHADGRRAPVWGRRGGGDVRGRHGRAGHRDGDRRQRRPLPWLAGRRRRARARPGDARRAGLLVRARTAASRPSRPSPRSSGTCSRRPAGWRLPRTSRRSGIATPRWPRSCGRPGSWSARPSGTRRC